MTSFDSIDVDSSYNIAVGGKGSDPGVLDATSSPNPIAALMNNGGLFRWAKYFSNSLNSISIIKYSPDFSKLVGVFDTAPLSLVLLNALDGLIINSYTAGNGGGSVTSAGVLLDSTNNIYIAMSNNAGRGELIKFSLSPPPVSLAFSMQMNKGGTFLTSVIFGTSENELYIGGFNMDFFNSRVHYTARIDSAGSMSWEYGHNFLTFPNYHHVSRMSHHSSGYVIGCSEEQSSPQSRITFFRLHLNTGSPNLIPWGYSGRRMTISGAAVDCKSVSPGDGSTSYYAVQYSTTGSFKLVIMNFPGNSVQLVDLNTFSGLGYTLTGAHIVSATVAFYVGQSQTVTTATPSQFLSQQSAFIMNNDPAWSCCTFSTTPVGQGSGGHGYAWATGLIYSWGSRGTTMNNAGITNADIFDTTLVPTTWCGLSVVVTMTPSILVDQTHDISMLTPTLYTFPDFILDVTCADIATIQYSATLLDGITPVPLYLTLNSLTKTFTIAANNILDVTASPIGILLTALAPTGLTASTSFQLTITNLCATGTIAPSASLTPIIYSITQTTLVVPIPPFSTVPTYCATNFVVTQTDGTPLDPSIFTVDYVLKTITIQSNDNTKVGANIFQAYGLKIDGALFYAPSTTSTQTTCVDIYHECTLATLTPPLLDTAQTYVLYSAIMPIIAPVAPFTSDKTNFLCGAFVYECYSDLAITTLDTSVFNFNPATRTISVQSFDRLKLGTHRLTVKGYQGIFSTTFTTYAFDLTITDPCPTATIFTTPVVPQNYLILQPSLPIPITPFTESVGGYCGPFTYTLSTNPAPTVISLDSTIPQINVYTGDFTQNGLVHTAVLTGTIPSGVFANLNVQISIAYDCNLAKVVVPKVLDQVYTVKDAELSFSIPFFTSDHPAAECGNFVYTLQNKDGTSPDSIFTLQLGVSSLFLSVQTNDNNKALLYNLQIVGQQSGASTLKTPTDIKMLIKLFVEVPNDGPPEFQGVISDQNVNLNDTLRYSLPKIIDPDNDKYQIKILVNGNEEVPGFIIYTDTIFIANPTDVQHMGEYTITIILTDTNKNPQSKTYTFKLKVLQPKSQDDGQAQSDSSESGFKVKKVEEKADRDFFAVIFQITMIGEMTVKFSEDVIVPSNYSQYGTNQLNIYVWSDNPKKLEGTKLNWEIIDFTSSNMLIQLRFSSPELISNEQVILFIDVIGERQDTSNIYIKRLLFGQKGQNSNSIYARHKQRMSKTKILQISFVKDIASQNSITSLISTTEIATVTAVAGASLASIVISQSFQLAWTLINFLQLLLHLVLLTVNYPIKAYEILIYLVKLANYEIVDTESLINRIYEFPKIEEGQEIPSVFTDFGYDSLNIFQNLGMIILYSFILVGLIILIQILHCFKSRFEKQASNFIVQSEEIA